MTTQKIPRRARRVTALVTATITAAAMMTLWQPLEAHAAPPSASSWSTPGHYNWTVPDSVTQFKVEVLGGAGGNDDGGAGAAITGTLDVSPGDSVSIYVAEGGATGAFGGGSDSYGAGGYGYGNGADGGSGSWPAQGGGGGGGSSAVAIEGTSKAVAGGGGGGGGEADCFPNPGGNAGQDGYKVEPSGGLCPSWGGDPGLAGESNTRHGLSGDNAGSSSGQGGGGGGGGGSSSNGGGGGADASTDGGGGGGGGTNVCTLDNCNTAHHGGFNGKVTLTPVYSTATSLNVTPSSAVTGQTATVSGEVDYADSNSGLDAPQGNITITSNSTTIKTLAVDSAGQFNYTCTVPCGLEPSSSLDATFTPESEWWLESSGSTTPDFEKGATRTAIDIDPTNVVTGQNIDAVATVDVLAPAEGTPTGDVEFWSDNPTGDNPELIGTATLDSAVQAHLSFPSDFSGGQRFWATYPGDDGFLDSTSPKQTIHSSPADTETTIDFAPAPSIIGQDVDVTIGVDVLAPGGGQVDGDVQLDIAGEQYVAELDNGEVSIDVPNLDVGDHDATAQYLGSTMYNESEITDTHTVDPADADVVLSQDTDDSVAGESVTFTADVDVVDPGDTPVTGAVQFLVDDEPWEDPVEITDDGAAILETSSLPVGSREITAAFLGTARINPATSNPIDHEVDQALSTTTLELDPDTSVTIGEEVGTIVTVEPQEPSQETPAGDVVLFVDGKEYGDPVELDEDGVATFILTDLEIGDHDVVAEFIATDRFAGSTSNEETASVKPALSTTTIDIPEKSMLGKPVTATATVTSESDAPSAVAPGLLEALDAQLPTAAGKVQFYLDGEKHGKPVSLTTGDAGPTATIEFTELEVGAHKVHAKYLGSNTVEGSTSDKSPHKVTAPVAKEPKTPGISGQHGAGQTAGQPGGNLPRTGVELVGASAAATLMLLTGFSLATIRRRRSR